MHITVNLILLCFMTICRQMRYGIHFRTTKKIIFGVQIYKFLLVYLYIFQSHSSQCPLSVVNLILLCFMTICRQMRYGIHFRTTKKIIFGVQIYRFLLVYLYIFQSHSSQCPLSVVQCTSCSAQFPRQHSTVHMSECPKAKVKCQYTFLGCGFEVRFSTLFICM